MVFQDRSHPFFPGHAAFSNFFNEPGTIVADKTHFIPLLEKNPFQYMFLRPRRWGKSTFLNMLAAYYDIKEKDSFQEIFGGLYIGSAPTKSRNSHLILHFDFSTITPIGPFEQISRSIFDNISWSLRKLLFKYQDVLGNGSPEEYIIPNEIAISLRNVLVSKCGAKYYHTIESDNRISFTEMAIPLSLASTSMMPRPTFI
jgi:Predicted AAA-ATPase